MGFRFQKRLRILPGLTLNLSKSGISTSVGMRGARITKGHGKTRVTVGLPGTGLSHSSVSQGKASVRRVAKVQGYPSWRVIFLAAACIVLLLLLAFLPAQVNAQVRCAMPNGVLITQQLGGCPRDAVQVDAAPSAPVTAKAKSLEVGSAAPSVSLSPGAAGPSVEVDGRRQFSFAWVAVFVVVAGVFFAVKTVSGALSRDSFCTSCGHQGPAKTVTRGSIFIEILLWICFLVPGIIYSIWRLTSKHKACSQCGAQSLIAPESPVAIAMKKALGQHAS